MSTARDIADHDMQGAEIPEVYISLHFPGLFMAEDIGDISTTGTSLWDFLKIYSFSSQSKILCVFRM